MSADDVETLAMQEVLARLSENPRPDTPEPSSRQGRRNGSGSDVQLLDDDGSISEKVRCTVLGRQRQI